MSNPYMHQHEPFGGGGRGIRTPGGCNTSMVFKTIAIVRSAIPPPISVKGRSTCNDLPVASIIQGEVAESGRRRSPAKGVRA